jgi:tetratricopeptide (TPR) repeat protein
MAIGLDDALLSWLAASAGDAVVRRLRDPPAIRAMRQVVEQAADTTVAEVAGHLDGHQAEHLRRSLLIRDTIPSVGGATVTSEAELRRALHAWTAALNQPEFGESGYLCELDVDAQLLADTLTSNIAAGIQHNGRSGGALDGLAAWLWRYGVSDHLARIELKLDASVGTVEPVGGGLPGGTPDFTGRQQALDELTQRVQAHDPAGAVVAIHAVDGMAGVGKTELALRAAHQHKHRYPDGQYFLNLHGYTEGVPPMLPAVALEELLRQAGVPGPAVPPDLASRQERWRSLMATRRALVLLDNALDADQVRSLLPGSAGSLVLITSRTRLPGLPGAKPLRLDVLPPDEAVELFTRLVDTVRPLDLDTVATVVHLVGRLPVAVQAVAALVDDRYTEADLADEIAEARAGVGLVDEASPLDVGVRAAFETSLARLDQPNRQAFWMLGVHPGPSLGVPQYAALADLPVVTARARLRALADRNLLIASGDRVGHHRYELHDLMRAFARKQATSHLTVGDQALAIGRLTAWYAAAMAAIARLSIATGSDSDQSGVEGLDLDRPAVSHQWMVAEQENLLAFAEAATGVSAAQVCQAAARRLYYLDYYTTARALYHTAATLHRQAGSLGGEAGAWWGLGDVARLTGDYQSAAEYYRAAEATFTEIGDRRGEAGARRGLGDVALRTDDYQGAAEHFQTAQSICAEIGARAGEAGALRGLGQVSRVTGDYRGAAEHFQTAQNIYAAIGERAGEADARRGLGRVALATGDHQRAAEHFQTAQNIYAEIGNPGREADARRGLGRVALAIGDHQRAAEHFQTAQRVCAEVGNRGREADARLGLGDVARLTGDYQSAAEHYRTAQNTYKEIGNRIGAAGALRGLGDVAYAQRRCGDARERWEAALRIYEGIGHPSAASVRDRLVRLEVE